MKRNIILLVFLVYAVSSFGQTSSLNEGNKCFDEGDYSCAITKFNEVIKSATGSENQIAEINLGRARSCSEWLTTANQYFSRQNFTDASIHYQNVLNENPNDSYAKEQLEKCNFALITLKVSKNRLLFSDIGGNESITVTTQADTYSINGMLSWCTIRKGENSFIISCDENTEYIGRSGSYTVRAGNKTQKINISQDSKKAEISLTISTRQILFPQFVVGRPIIDVITNASDYTITNLPTWCKIGKKSDSWFSLACETNNTGKARKGLILVSARDKDVQIEISQSGPTYTGTQKSNSTVSSRNNTSSRVKKGKCFNCPKTKDSWGLTLGYTQLKYNPFEKLPLSPNAYLNGIQLGLHFEPLFKYGFGLNTGIFLEANSRHAASTLTSDFNFRQYSLNIPLHLEYRFNFSKWFNVFAFGGPAFNVIANSSFKEYSMPATLEYGAGLRINRIQFHVGKSLYLGSFSDMANVRENMFDIGKNPIVYNDLIVGISYMF